MLKNVILYILLHIFWSMPIKNNRILFMSYAGKYYNDNPKAISDYLSKHFKGCELIWLVNKNLCINHTSDNIKFVNKKSLIALYMLATSKIWVDNCRKAPWIRKRKKQYYIQTWHGGITLKMVEKDVETLLPKNHIKCAKNDSLMADLIISNSKWNTNVIKRAFWYNGKILECGTPRLDSHFHLKYHDLAITKKRIGLSENMNYVLYAPTFRNSGDLNIYKLDYEKLCNALSKKFSGNWTVLLRLHPNIRKLGTKIIETEKCINVTEYPDMYDLLDISEILITDYSSSMFEAGFLNKKVFLYCGDLEKYQKERPLYFDIKSLPYLLAQTMEELEHQIKIFDWIHYKKQLETFNRKLGILETGKSCAVICDIIRNKLAT